MCPYTRVLQRYVADPLLVRGRFKFHLRVMVLAVGDLKVYVHDNAVALCAAEPLFDAGEGRPAGSPGVGDGDRVREEVHCGQPVRGGGNGGSGRGGGGEAGVRGIGGVGFDLSNKFAHATNHCVQKRHASADHAGVGLAADAQITQNPACIAVATDTTFEAVTRALL